MQQRQNGDTGISVREPNLTGAMGKREKGWYSFLPSRH